MQQPYKIESLDLAIADLEPNPWNPNEMSNFMLTKAEESLDRFGQIKRVVVRPHPKEKGRYQILDGFHRTRILGQKGCDRIRCDVIYDIPDQEAKRLGLALNDIHGENDREKLGQLLCEIHGDDDEALPWDEDQLAHLMGLGDQGDDEQTENCELTTDDSPFSRENLQTVVLRMTPASYSELEQACAELQDELPDMQDKRELLGLVVAKLLQ